jgi:hypothetical protein
MYIFNDSLKQDGQIKPESGLCLKREHMAEIGMDETEIRKQEMVSVVKTLTCT